jgi:DNA polymerase III alpha subunit
MLPCVNRSGREFGIEAGAIRVGLGRVRGLSDSSAASVLASRPFAGLADFLARTSVKLAEAEALVRAGALDFTGRPRPEMLLELHTSFPSGRRAGAAGEALVPFAGVAAGLPRLGDRPPSARRRDEWELLELSVAAHPLAGSRPRLARLGAATSGALALPAWVGRKIRLAGVVAARRTVRTDSGGSMCFLTLSDEDGLFEVTVFPPLYRQARSALSGAGLGPLVVAGVVEDQYGALSVRATEGPKGLKRRE